MPLSLKESRALTEAAKLLYTFLPGSGASAWKRHVTFGSVANSAGVGDFWLGGSKEPAIAKLLELTLEHRRGSFERLILEIVREGITYRQKNGKPIARSEIIHLNQVIKEVGFKFPELWDESFLDSLTGARSDPSGEPKTNAESRASENGRNAKELERLRCEFLSLAVASDRQQAGLQFESVLRRMFALFGLEPRLSYRVVGEQIDGSIKLDSEIYLVEAKWEAAKMSEAALLVFRGKVEGKSSVTRGVFIAANGFTEEALDALGRGKQPNFFLVDGYDISIVLHGYIDLHSLLREKQRRFAEEGKLLHRVALATA